MNSQFASQFAFQKSQFPVQTQPQLQQLSQYQQTLVPWNRIKEIDLKQIYEDNDVFQLESCMPMIANCMISPEEYNEENSEELLKILQIYQFSLEYFLYSNEYYDNVLDNLKAENETIQSNVNVEKKNIAQMNKKYKALSDKYLIKKKALDKYKVFLEHNQTFKCHLCSNKFFISEEYLDAHIQRRHPEIAHQKKYNEDLSNSNSKYKEKLLEEQNQFYKKIIEQQAKPEYNKEDIIQLKMLIAEQQEQIKILNAKELQAQLKQPPKVQEDNNQQKQTNNNQQTHTTEINQIKIFTQQEGFYESIINPNRQFETQQKQQSSGDNISVEIPNTFLQIKKFETNKEEVPIQKIIQDYNAGELEDDNDSMEIEREEEADEVLSQHFEQYPMDEETNENAQKKLEIAEKQFREENKLYALVNNESQLVTDPQILKTQDIKVEDEFKQVFQKTYKIPFDELNNLENERLSSLLNTKKQVGKQSKGIMKI